MTVRRFVPLVLGLAMACKGGDTTDTTDTDTTSPTDDTDVFVGDTDNNTLDGATALDAGIWSGIDAGTVVDLTSEVIDPSDDVDFWTLPVTADQPYLVWASTTEGSGCDLALRVHLDTASTQSFSNDDMPFRVLGTDPGLRFVPHTTGTVTLEVAEYNAFIGQTGEGGPHCVYQLHAMLAPVSEEECNDLPTVQALAEGADDTDSAVDFPGVLLSSPFRSTDRDFNGYVDFHEDEDLWTFEFGELPGLAGGHVWTWSLLPLYPLTGTGAQQAQELVLYDSDFQVLARSTDPYPDGRIGFLDDVGIAYPVSSFTTYYVAVQKLDTTVIEPTDTGDTGEDSDTGDTGIGVDSGSGLVDTAGDSGVGIGGDSGAGSGLVDTGGDSGVGIGGDSGTGTGMGTGTGLGDTGGDSGTGSGLETGVAEDSGVGIGGDSGTGTGLVDSGTESGVETGLAGDSGAGIGGDSGTGTGTGDTGIGGDSGTVDTGSDSGSGAGDSDSGVDTGIGWLPGEQGVGNPAFYNGTTFGYGNELLTCEGVTPSTADWLEVEAGNDRNDAFNDARLVTFCHSTGTSLYYARVIGQIEVLEGSEPPFVRVEDGDPTPDLPACTEGDPCVDRDVYVINLSSAAGGSIAGRRLTIALQADSVGSALDAELLLFSNNNFTEPLATSEPESLYALGGNDPVLAYDIPDDTQSVFLLVQPKVDGGAYGSTDAQNPYFLRFVLDELDETTGTTK